jgi:hypothetical protein
MHRSTYFLIIYRRIVKYSVFQYGILYVFPYSESLEAPKIVFVVAFAYNTVPNLGNICDKTIQTYQVVSY